MSSRAEKESRDLRSKSLANAFKSPSKASSSSSSSQSEEKKGIPKVRLDDLPCRGFGQGVFHNFHTNQLVSRAKPCSAYLRCMLELMGLGFISGCLVSISLGFIFFLLIETAISSGWKASISVILGVLLGDSLLLAIALFFSQSLSQVLSEMGDGLQWAAGSMFLGMGLYQLTHPRTTKETSIKGGSTLFVQAFLINLGNPSNWTFWLVLYSAPPVSYAQLSGKWAFGLSALASIVACSLLVSCIAAKSGRYLPDKTVLRINQAVSVGLVLVGLYWLFGVR
jgi:threonine/homoserine/homoserine lactone efflux protein